MLGKLRVKFLPGPLWWAGPWPGCSSRLKLPGGWEEADKSSPLWEGLLAHLHPRKVPTNSFLHCPAPKMIQESRLGWNDGSVIATETKQNKGNSHCSSSLLKNPSSPHINKVQSFLQAGVGIHPFHPPGFRQFSVPSPSTFPPPRAPGRLRSWAEAPGASGSVFRMVL